MEQDFRLQKRWNERTADMIREFVNLVFAGFPLAIAVLHEKLRTGLNWTCMEYPLRYMWTVEDDPEAEKEEWEESDKGSVEDSIAADEDLGQEESFLTEREDDDVQLEEIHAGIGQPSEVHRPESELVPGD